MASSPKVVFGRLSEKLHTPVANLVITGVGLMAIFLDVATSTSFINFGAFTAFTLVNASVVFQYVRQRRAGQQLNPVSYVVVPVIGAIIFAYLLSQLDSSAITLSKELEEAVMDEFPSVDRCQEGCAAYHLGVAEARACGAGEGYRVLRGGVPRISKTLSGSC